MQKEKNNIFYLKEDTCISIEERFGFLEYHGTEKLSGWLLNYEVLNHENSMETALYFVKENGENFKVVTPFYLSFLLETTDNFCVMEYLYKKYKAYINHIEVKEKINISTLNHLNLPKTKYLKVFVKHDEGLSTLIQDIKTIIFEKSRNNREMFINETESIYAPDHILAFYENDISWDIQAADNLNIRCGLWFDISFDGSKHVIEKNKELVKYPNLRIFAFDIETCKQPLKFPKAEHDKVMMISIKTESFGALIINREIVSEQIESFRYVPNEEMATDFVVYNEETEKELLIKFVEIIQSHMPHLTTTFNGAYFDYDFIRIRMEKHGMSFSDLTGIKKIGDYYTGSFCVHLDCYKWVKRDSYLPISCQGLKAATRAKLGYEPDEIDPEDMMRCAKEEPQKMASYSVSDAVATYHLYMKFVHSHIFSLCSLIPYPPDKTLTKGSGSLCESLLITQANSYDVVVPSVKRLNGLQHYNNHIAENLTYVGGHVESLKAGIFRADFMHDFTFDYDIIKMLEENYDDMMEKYCKYENYAKAKKEVFEKFKNCKNKINCTGKIYHLDVGAMYPNIILTNRLQPVSAVSERVCINCDYNNDENDCKRNLNWISRAEYYPATEAEVQNILNQLRDQEFIVTNKTKKGETIERKEKYDNLPESRKEALLKEKLEAFCRIFYKKTKFKKEEIQTTTVCQREVPFYVNTVKMFKEKRYEMKNLHKLAQKEAEENPTKENVDKSNIYNSLQVAYKCILNSFYGYVMRKGSRWWSIDMAAITCHLGGEIIKLAKKIVSGFGIPLELDTDGIWALIPDCFPVEVTMGGKKVFILNEILNYFVCKTGTNYQYQQMFLEEGKVKWKKSTENHIFFEIDGPYKTMAIPSSTEENKLLKKRYVVFDFNDKITEIKGFELKRRGELSFIKKFQEDIFPKFCSGKTLNECYKNLTEIAKYWLNIIDKRGKQLDDETLFDLFSESRSMSKDINEYCDKKSNILSTARRIAEILGDDVLEEKLKCEFVVSRYPDMESTADRVVPILVFKIANKEKYLEKWLGVLKSYEIRDILDWDYYRKRFEYILQRIIIIPAYFQGISNLFGNVENVKWLQPAKKYFNEAKDIEECSVKTKFFYTKNYLSELQKTREKEMITENKEECVKKTKHINEDVKCSTRELNPMMYRKVANFIKEMEEEWLNFYDKKINNVVDAYKVEYVCDTVTCQEEHKKQTIIDAFMIQEKNEQMETSLEINDVKECKKEQDDCKSYVYFYDFCSYKRIPFVHRLFLEINDLEFFSNLNVKTIEVNTEGVKKCFELMMNPSEFQKYQDEKFFDHFSIRKIYGHHDPLTQVLITSDCVLGKTRFFTLSSLQHNQKITFFYKHNDTFLFADKENIIKKIKEERKSIQICFIEKNDSGCKMILEKLNMPVCQVDILCSSNLQMGKDVNTTQRKLHDKLEKEAELLLSLNKITGIPLCNISKESVLDIFWLKTCNKNGLVVEKRNEKDKLFVFKNEYLKSGYHNTFSYQLEITHAFIYAIIEYDSFLQNKKYDGVKRNEFLVLVEFLKNIMVKAAEDEDGALFLCKKIHKWLKKETVYISTTLKETINILQQQLIVQLTSILKEKQTNVFCCSLDVVFLDTKKTTLEEANKVLEFIQKDINRLNGYELIELTPLRVFNQISFVEPEIWFYQKNNEYFSSTKKYHIPKNVLTKYFESENVDDYFVFDNITSMDFESAKLFLRMLSYRRNTHGLVTNCYKLLKSSEFTQPDIFNINATIFCDTCGSENFMRKNCIKCLNEINTLVIEKECESFLNQCWFEQAEGDKYCSNCGNHEDRRLKEYCHCGGKYEFKNYGETYKNLKKFVNTEDFKNKVKRIESFFQ